MSGALSAAVRRHWQSPPPWWLRWPARAYGALMALRRRLYRAGWLRSAHVPVPVVVVGNIVAGGAGKTPLVAAIAEGLARRGLRVGVVSRGYGRRTREARRVAEADLAPDVGDEPRMFADLGFPVAVAARRIEAARMLAGDCDVLLADDGLQHYALARDVEIAVVDGVHRHGNGWLLPAGPLREPVGRLERVDHVVCNGGTPAPGEVPMRLLPGEAVPLAGGAPVPLSRWTGSEVDAVAGIGDPGRFFAMLQAHGLHVRGHAFPDHHDYAPGDLAGLGDGPVLMTAKDAVKLRRHARPGWHVVPVRAQLPEDFLDAIHARVQRARGAPA